ncbi:unnamed protein product [Ostreobium quekettii]|uniref:Uncharacterized protein n=1 Tax=Ostreobium quekettii TaxID=121088 RepID=A0A8S1JHQ1_9CHLO|nr:unnamed protein product [Ostreobium quekettii]|eukprot:evm.model.scf_2469EXC.1 EVM.evm.TU.scf_2469EXC.1   scf_2469EXC:9415-11815(-)
MTLWESSPGGCAARKNSGLPVEVPEGMGRRSDTWVVSNIQDYEQAKRFKLDHGGSNMGPAAGLSPGLAMQQSAQQARMYARMPGHGLVQDKALSDRPMHPGFVPSEAEAACKTARRSSLDSTTNSTGTKVVPVGSGGQSLLSGSLPHGRPVMTFVDHTSGNAQQHAVYPPLNGQQIVGNVGAQQYSPHVRMLQEQRFQAMQQQLQQARGLQGRQYAANGVTPGVIGAQHAAAASYTAAAQGRAQTYASQATLAKPSYGSGMAGQGGQNVVLSPQLSTVGSCGNPGGSAGAAPAKIDETWSSLRQAPRSSQGPMKYSAAAESNNGGTGMVAISQVAQKQDAASMPAMGNSCVPMSSNKTLAPSPQEHAGGPFPSTNGNSSSVASTDGPGASQNGTPESNNPAEKNGHHASLDAVREKGLGPRFENGDTGDLDNGNGLLDADVGNPLFTDVNTGSPGFGADLDLGELCDMGVQ